MIDNKGYSLQDINKEMKEMIEEDTVNHLELFVAKDSSKLSVTLTPYKSDSEGQNNIHSYHGLHPSFNAQKLIDLLFYTKQINKDDIFWEKVISLQKENRYMNLIEMLPGQANVNFKDTDILVTLLGRAILQMATHFGVEVQISEKTKDFVSDLKSILCEHTMFPKLFFSECTGLLNLNVSKVRLFGIWPLNVIKKLIKKYDYNPDTNEIISNLNAETSSENNLFKILTFDQIYRKHYGLVNTDVYYSGVMPHVMRIRYDDALTNVKGVKCLQFEVVRTTYATVDFMDHPLIIYHPFFMSSLDNSTRLQLMLDFDKYEDLISPLITLDN